MTYVNKKLVFFSWIFSDRFTRVNWHESIHFHLESMYRCPVCTLCEKHSIVAHPCKLWIWVHQNSSVLAVKNEIRTLGLSTICDMTMQHIYNVCAIHFYDFVHEFVMLYKIFFYELWNFEREKGRRIYIGGSKEIHGCVYKKVAIPFLLNLVIEKL